MPGLSITLSSRSVPRDPRIRAHLDGGRQRLCAAADGRLSRAHGRRAAGRAVPRRDLSGDVGRRAHFDRHRAKFSGAAGRVGPAGGAIFAAQVAARGAEKKVLSFDMGGTTAKICLIENFEPNSARVYEVDRAARFLKGSGLPVRIPVIEMVEIGAGGGSIARVDALEARHGRAGKRGLGAGPGLLWARRHAADRDRRRCRARHDRSGGIRGRHDRAQSGSVARRAGGGGRRSARAVAGDGGLRGARDGRARTWRAPRACMRSSAARS